MTRTRALGYALAVLLWGGDVEPSAAQEPTDAGRARAGITGAVLDAASGLPVDGATVVLQPEVMGAFPAGAASGSAFAAGARYVITDTTGAYRFDALASGVYRVYVSRLGYRPYSVTVELRGGALSPVAIALAAEAIPLEPVRSRGHSRGSYEAARAFSPGVGAARLLAADLRRLRFLTTDVREFTHADVMEAVTLGEPDILRALQRLPGVATRSDYTAELWTRGAPWSQTRVYFDGVPLYNPLHALGVLSGIGSNAIGAVWFHPGARSAAIPEGAAGVVDIQSRRAHGSGELNAYADVSLLSAGLALDQRVLDGRAGWMLSGRRTYLDWLTRLARHATDDADAAFPYGFAEVAGSVDAWVGAGSSVEASWLWERDHLTSVTRGSGQRLRGEWGNVAGRASFTTRVGRIHVRHTAGLSWHDGMVVPEAQPGRGMPLAGALRRDGDTQVGYQGVTGTIWPEPESVAGPAWSFGYGIEEQHARYYGPRPLPVPRFSLAAMEDGVRVWWHARLPMASLWAERSWDLGERLGIRTGLRAEASDALMNAGRVRWSPRLSARYAPLPEVALSAGLSRVHQYTQAFAPGGMYLASLATTDVWLLASATTPVLRSDIATLGIETWLAPGRVVTLNGFARRATGVAAADPTPGRVQDRPPFVTGENEAAGVEVSVRQLTGRITGSAAYSLSRSVMDAAGLRYAAPSDRPHVLSVTAMLHASSALRIGAAYTAASGVPFTLMVSTVEECAAEPLCDPATLPWIGPPSAARAPTFASLDLLLDWSARLRGLEVGAYAQLRNALGRENSTIYTADPQGCMPAGCSGDLRSEFERGLPRLPVLGLRVRH